MISLSRRRFLHAAVGAGVASGFVLPSLAAVADERPNVVMIVSDDQGWTDFGFMGHPTIKTPRIDRLAEESAVFPLGYTPTSLCRASLATLLTGLHPHQHRICCNDPPMGVDRARMHPFLRNSPTVPRLLGEAKYRSLQTGKFWEGDYRNGGFTHGQSTAADRHISTKLPQIGRQTMQPIYDFIDESRDQKFFVWYAPMMPHMPHNPPERLLKRYQTDGRDIAIARYFAMCEWFDETVGQLLDHLERRQLTRDTLVVFCADNGWIQPVQAENKQPSVGGEGGKRSPYDMGIRTPILLRLPGKTRAGRYEDLVQTPDLAPTILAACGQRPPREMHGLSLLDVAAGRGRLNRDALFGEIYVHTATELGRPDLDVTHRWVREGEWKLIDHLRDRKQELFHISRDPRERTDLAEKEADHVARLRERIAAWVRGR